jgi:hypothetical protein
MHPHEHNVSLSTAQARLATHFRPGKLYKFLAEVYMYDIGKWEEVSAGQKEAVIGSVFMVCAEQTYESFSATSLTPDGHMCVRILYDEGLYYLRFHPQTNRVSADTFMPLEDLDK